jgi:hypothetical protein
MAIWGYAAGSMNLTLGLSLSGRTIFSRTAFQITSWMDVEDFAGEDFAGLRGQRFSVYSSIKEVP